MLTRLAAAVFNRFSVPWQRRVLALRVPRFFVGVAALCVEGDRVLLARHRFGDPRWRLPGGFLRRHETVSECIKREVMEELGAEIEVAEILDVIAGYRHPRVEVIVRCQLRGRPQIRSAELEDFGFFKPTDLPPLRSDQRRVIESVLSELARST